MNKSMKVAVLLISLAALTGCFSHPNKNLAKTKEAPLVTDSTAEPTVAGAGDVQQFSGQDTDNTLTKDDLLNKVVFYFDFDDSTVKGEYLKSLQEHADYLINHPGAIVRVEGHTDERGSREYNIALGERRAQAVARILKLDGVSQDQVTTVSYGQEKPAVLGHSESSWHFNRRAVVLYEAG